MDTVYVILDHTARVLSSEEFLAKATTTVGGVVSLWILFKKSFRRWQEESKPEPHSIDPEYISRTDDIRRKLHVIKDRMDASRVWVIQYRNGVKFTLSHPEFKLCAATEVVAKGVTTGAEEVQAVPVNSWFDVVAKCIKPSRPTPGARILSNKLGRSIIHHMPSEMEPSHFTNTAESIGIGQTICVPLVNKNEQPLGLLMLQYIHDNELTNLEEHYDLLVRSAKAIEIMLDVNHN